MTIDLWRLYTNTDPEFPGFVGAVVDRAIDVRNEWEKRRNG